MPANDYEKIQMPRCVALIPAAGTGSRAAGSCPKQYLPVLGKPMLAYSVETLLSHPRISAVFVVIAPDDDALQAFQAASLDQRAKPIRAGGATRFQSVRNGLHALGDDVGSDDWILVHDAARPCLTAALLDRLLSGIGEDPVGGLLGCRVADTLKSADAHNRVSATRPREGLWGAQTPQMFRRGLLERALSEAPSELITDESSAVERLGFQPLLIESDAENIKVTFPGDLGLAEAILKARKGC